MLHVVRLFYKLHASLAQLAEHALRTSNTNSPGTHLLVHRTSVRSVVRSRVEAVSIPGGPGAPGLIV